MTRPAIGSIIALGAFLCCSCGTDVGTDKTTPAPAGAAQQQQGKGGVKAAAGGGVMPPPEIPKPGEHVGAPPAGAKSGGG